jgi:hypothetical protein
MQRARRNHLLRRRYAKFQLGRPIRAQGRRAIPRAITGAAARIAYRSCGHMWETGNCRPGVAATSAFV